MSTLSAAPPGTVTLLRGHWAQQYAEAVKVYSGFDHDSLLHGFRRDAGLPHPGEPLTGWCKNDASMVFGQLISTLSAFAAQGQDAALRDQVVSLTDGWIETFDPDQFGILDHRMSPGGHYTFDKFVGGLTDVGSLLGYDGAYQALDRFVAVGEQYLDRENIPASTVPALHSGRAGEWYTLSENLYRAALATGSDRYAAFGDVWNYDAYWDKFQASARPDDAFGVHAYSHLNTFGSAIASYTVHGDERRLEISKNAYDFFTETQCYVTGGFGPSERIQRPGSLAASLDRRMDSFETPCGSWAVFKLARQLLEHTGDARFGGWIERIFTNAIGAALPTNALGEHFYYADYRPTGAIKALNRDTYCCCFGTYGQSIAAYPSLVFFLGEDAVHINLFTPAELRTRLGTGEVTVRIETEYPTTSGVTVQVTVPTARRLKLAFRVPETTESLAGLRVGDELSPESALESGWLVLDREWQAGTTTIAFDLGLDWHEEPVSQDRPDRYAIMRGPVVQVLDAWRHEPLPGDPKPSDAAATPTGTPLGFDVVPEAGVEFEARLRPFYEIPEAWSYRMYFDRAAEPAQFY